MKLEPQINTQQMQHPLKKAEWKSLSDVEKTKVLLGSLRMVDEVRFINEWGSWEAPEAKKYEPKK